MLVLLKLFFFNIIVVFQGDFFEWKNSIIIKCCKFEIICFSGNIIFGDQLVLKLNKQFKIMVKNEGQEVIEGSILDFEGNVIWNLQQNLAK